MDILDKDEMLDLLQIENFLSLGLWDLRTFSFWQEFWNTKSNFHLESFA